jgi:hypothetical protein
MLGQEFHRLLEVVVRRHCDQLPGRDLADGRVLRLATFGHDPDHDVAVGDEPDQGSVFDNRNRAEILPGHEHGGLLDFAVGSQASTSRVITSLTIVPICPALSSVSGDR